MSSTRRQQELVEESIASALRYSDKVAQQYLKLRQDIFELSKKDVDDELRHIKTEQYRCELERAYEQYRVHIQSMQRAMHVHGSAKISNLDRLGPQLAKLEAEQEELRARLRKIQQVQRPMLDQMKTLSKNFDTGLRPRGGRRGGRRDQDRNGRDAELDRDVFEVDRGDIEQVFKGDEFSPEIDWLAHIGDVFTGRSLRKSGGKYVYDINRGAGHAALASTTVEEYDRIIAGLLRDIGGLVEHGQVAKARWERNAEKVQRIRAEAER